MMHRKRMGQQSREQYKQYFHAKLFDDFCKHRAIRLIHTVPRVVGPCDRRCARVVGWSLGWSLGWSPLF
jgi:hypothetical protein